MPKRKQDLEGKRILAVVAPERFRDEELFEPRTVLEARGAFVAVASTRPGAASGMLGRVAPTGAVVDQCRADEYDAIFVVGGLGSPKYLWEHAGLLALVRDMAAARKVVGAICLSSVVLSNAGVLRGRRATVFESEGTVEALKRGLAQYTGHPIEVDGSIVTAQGPQVASMFADALGDAIAAARLGATPTPTPVPSSLAAKGDSKARAKREGAGGASPWDSGPL